MVLLFVLGFSDGSIWSRAFIKKKEPEKNPTAPGPLSEKMGPFHTDCTWVSSQSCHLPPSSWPLTSSRKPVSFSPLRSLGVFSTAHVPSLISKPRKPNPNSLSSWSPGISGLSPAYWACSQLLLIYFSNLALSCEEMSPWR